MSYKVEHRGILCSPHRRCQWGYKWFSVQSIQHQVEGWKVDRRSLINKPPALMCWNVTFVSWAQTLWSQGPKDSQWHSEGTNGTKTEHGPLEYVHSWSLGDTGTKKLSSETNSGKSLLSDPACVYATSEEMKRLKRVTHLGCDFPLQSDFLDICLVDSCTRFSLHSLLLVLTYMLLRGINILRLLQRFFIMQTDTN